MANEEFVCYQIWKPTSHKKKKKKKNWIPTLIFFFFQKKEHTKLLFMDW